MTGKIAASTLLAVPVVAVLAAAAASQPAPKPLRVTETVDFHGLESVPTAVSGSVQSFAFLGPSRCDADGNLFLVPRPDAASGRSVDTVRRIAASGMTTEFDLRTALGLTAKEAARINVVSLDDAGNLYVLGVVGSDETRLTMISFDNTGQYRWKRELDETTLSVDRFAVFNTGEYLLVGRHPRTLALRMAVMDEGGTLRDVKAPFAAKADGSLRIHAESGPDGRVYVAQDGERAVHAISATGAVTRQMELARPPTESASLLSVRLSGGRLAAVFADKPSQSTTQARWIVVHDVSTGEHLGTYGPVTNLLACYRSVGGADQFTMLSVLGGKWQLLIESAS